MFGLVAQIKGHTVPMHGHGDQGQLQSLWLLVAEVRQVHYRAAIVQQNNVLLS